MNKTFLRLGALALAGMMSISSFAQQIDHEKIRYRVIDSEKNYVAVQSPADFTETSLTVQAQFTLNYGEPNAATYIVTQIDDNAFQASSATQIWVNGSNLTYIGSKAFASSTAKTIYFNGSLNKNVQIGTYAFKNPSADDKNTLALTDNNSTLDLTWVTEDKVGVGAFAGVLLDGISKVTLGAGLENIPDEMFEGTKSNLNGGSFICTLPVESSLKSVGAYAFKDSGLSAFGYEVGTYWLPKDLKTVENYAFANTAIAPGNKLQFAKTLYSSSRIEVVGEYAFDGASWLDNECFENLFGSFKELIYKKGSFEGCGLTSVDLSESSINGVPADAFKNNPIASITLPQNCTSVGDNAFNVSVEHNIGDLNIPTTVQSIGDYAFNKITANNVFIRAERPFAITDISLPAIASNGHLWIPSVKGVLPAFQNDVDEDDIPTVWTELTYYQYLPDFPVGNIKYVGIQNKGDLSYKAESYVAVTKYDGNSWVTDPDAEVDVTIRDNFRYIYNTLNNGYSIYDQVCNVVEVDGDIFKTDGAKAQIKSIEFQTAEIKTVPVMKDLTKLERVVLTENIQTLPENVFQNDALLTSVNLGDTKVTVLPTNAFYGAAALEEINLTKIVTFNNSAVRATAIKEAYIPEAVNIYMNAFRQNPYLASVVFPKVEIVDQYAFSETAINEVTLPTTLATIYSNAFNTESLKKVNVSYEAVEDVPVITDDVFFLPAGSKQYKATLHTDNLTREDYLNLSGWYKFMAGTGVGIAVNGKRIAADEDNVYVLTDNSENPTESVSVSTNATVDVAYIRNFTSTAWQCWFVPFDIKVGDVEDVRFAQLYDTKQTENGTIIEYKELEEGDMVYANKPYVVKPASTGEVTFTANSIYATTEVNKITVSDVENSYTFAGTYAKKDGTDYDDNPWYGLNAKMGNFALAQGENAYINAYRFYMTKTVNGNNPYATEPTVKFIVLGDEDATGISGVNANEIPDGAMFDLMGRKIAAPAKGQVYIQNGVKKLAK